MKTLSLRCVLLLLLSLAPSPLAAGPGGDTVVTRTRTVTEVADGVYVIRHPDAPDTFPQGNTTVIVGADAVLVVDACYLPSSAAEDIAQIRRWTDRPVRYLVNTHWHFDHTMGNGTYAAAFPGLTVVAHAETRRQMEGYNPGWFTRFPARADRFREILASGKNPDGRPLTDVEKQDYARAVDGVAPVQAEFAAIVDRMPDLTFEGGLTLDLGGRRVEIRHLGRGNTAGDAIVYLPAERIVVAGDLVTHPVPYLGGGYPNEMAETLGRLARLDAQTLVPGHGDVLHGPDASGYVGRVAAFVRAVVAEVDREVHRRGNNARLLDEIQQAVQQSLDLAAWRQQFAGDDPDNRDFFDGFSFPGLVRAAYAEAWRR